MIPLWHFKPYIDRSGSLPVTPATIPMKWAENQTHDATLRCACCDRLLKGSHRWVEVVNGGSDVAVPGSDPDVQDAGYMGCFPVGETCARRHFGDATHPSDKIGPLQ